MDGAAIPTPYLQQFSIQHMPLATLKNEIESSQFFKTSFSTGHSRSFIIFLHSVVENFWNLFYRMI